MANTIKDIVIVGGGTAGWLCAGILAARHHQGEINISLVEASDIPTVGVGEGTWPTLRNTVREIGLDEKELFRQCFAGFKQGGKFVNWVRGNGDYYYHPFTVPMGYGRLDLAPYVDDIEQYAKASNFQEHICESGLAPRNLADSDFQGQCNYAYHLDAGAFAEMLKQHCRDKLNVRHVIGTVNDVTINQYGYIEKVKLTKSELSEIKGDIFVDCTGFRSLLLGDAMKVPFKSTDDILFNDTALAVRVPYKDKNTPVACHTIATGQNAGWIWDIGLTNRRGIGHVYSSDFLSDEAAENNLREYIGEQFEELDVKKIKFKSGYREQYWKNNCIAVGMSSGFVEPLEATAIMLVEVAARHLSEHLPPNKEVMRVVAKRFNQQMDYRWQRIIDFLKLHYMLTQRPEPYWQAHTDENSLPISLQDDLAIWKNRGPIKSDFDGVAELFPAASYQYVLYGMGFKPDFSQHSHLYQHKQQAQRLLQQNEQITQQMLKGLPAHREYIEHWLNS